MEELCVRAHKSWAIPWMRCIPMNSIGVGKSRGWDVCPWTLYIRSDINWQSQQTSCLSILLSVIQFILSLFIHLRGSSKVTPSTFLLEFEWTNPSWKVIGHNIIWFNIMCLFNSDHSSPLMRQWAPLSYHFFKLFLKAPHPT